MRDISVRKSIDKKTVTVQKVSSNEKRFVISWDVSLDPVPDDENIYRKIHSKYRLMFIAVLKELGKYQDIVEIESACFLTTKPEFEDISQGDLTDLIKQTLLGVPDKMQEADEYVKRSELKRTDVFVEFVVAPVEGFNIGSFDRALFYKIKSSK